jgi:pyridoxal phosphate enzyme (YggS family)
MPDLADRIATVRERITAAARAAQREPNEVRLIAVTKGVDTDIVQRAVALGVEDIGENRVLEAEAKRAQVTGAARWHLIGHLQTNKARRAAAIFDAVHSVDSERVARALAMLRPHERDPIALLIEVELTGIAGRTGVSAAGAEPLMRAIVGLPGVHLLGLMTIAAPSENGDDPRRIFAELRTLRDALQRGSGWPLPELSMGMTGDFEAAIAEGATMVRVGRAIFSDS